MNNKVVFIVHYLPIEKYPPAFNLLRCIAKDMPQNIDIHVITTKCEDDSKIEIPGIKIIRIRPLASGLRLKRFFSYINFHIRCFKELYRVSPLNILYYETLSSFSPIIYKVLYSKTSLLIHYHEYTTREEYRSGMLINKIFHAIEMRVYEKASWISHTNKYRANLFKKDINNKPLIIHAIPNCPPKEWDNIAAKVVRSGSNKIRLVYVGALSIESMYVEELVKWVASNSNLCDLTLFSDNCTNEVKRYVSDYKADNIFFKGAIKYDFLPEILPQFDVGVILYKGQILNYVYNAPNKFFEYLNCGLDVIYPDVMIGMEDYRERYADRLLIRANFNLLENIGHSLKSKKGHRIMSSACVAENEFRPIINQLFNFKYD